MKKELVISPATKPEVEENIAVSISVFFYGFSLVKNLRDANNYRYTKAAACCLRPYAFNTQVGITDWSEDSSTEVRKDILFKRSKCFSRYVFRFYCPVDFNDVVLSNSRAILQWR